MANEHQLWYFASMDMGVSHTLSRHFFWSENILWKEDVGDRNVTVSVSGRDLIVDTESVGRYMSSGNTDWTRRAMAEVPRLVDVDDAEDLDEGGDWKAVNGHVREVEVERDEDTDESGDAWKDRPWKGKGIEVLWFEGLDHAQVFDHTATRRPLLRAIRTYCAEGASGN
jgi:hypothetical protein